MRINSTFLLSCLLYSLAANAQWTNYQPAELAIGQPDFTTYSSYITANGFSGSYAIAIDADHAKLYIGDVSNHRVLRFAYPVTSNQPVAEIVFGQPDFVSNAAQNYFNLTGSWPDPTAKQILYPMSLAVYNGDLWVLDEYNNRVVKFSQAYNINQNNPDANVVIGQQSFITRDYSCTSKTFYTPWAITIDKNGNLWVGDTGNGRILKFNNASALPSGSAATGILGKQNFTDANISSAASQSNFNIISSLVVDDAGILWVCDKGFNRVLRFDNLPINPSGENAAAVLGQTDFISKSQATAPNTFMRPYGVCVDGNGTLYVADQSNNRVLIFTNAAAKSNGVSADNWLGSSFWSNSYTYGDKSFAPQSITNLVTDNARGKLFVCDVTASRIMQFASSNSLTGVSEKTEDASNAKDPFHLIVSESSGGSYTRISFKVSSPGFCTVRVYNSAGAEIARLVNENLQPGLYTAEWNPGNRSHGIYFCTIRQKNLSQTAKLFTGN